MMHHECREGVLDDDVRLAKASLDIAPTPGNIGKIVGRLLQRLGQALVIRHIRVNQPRPRL